MAELGGTFMAMTIPAGQSVCATCEHWEGPRQLSAWEGLATIEEWNLQGECVGGGAFGPGAVLPASSLCSSWTKWSKIKY